MEINEEKMKERCGGTQDISGKLNGYSGWARGVNGESHFQLE